MPLANAIILEGQ